MVVQSVITRIVSSKTRTDLESKWLAQSTERAIAQSSLIL